LIWLIEIKFILLMFSLTLMAENMCTRDLQAQSVDPDEELCQIAILWIKCMRQIKNVLSNYNTL